jgi:predicted porin
MLTLASDTFAGFQANAMYVLNNKNTNQTSVAAGSSGYTTATGTTNSTAWGLGVNYTWQKLLVTANYQNMTDKSGYTVNNTTGVYSAGAPQMGGYGGANATGTNDKDNQQYYAATYDFGILKAYVQYVNRKVSDVNNPNNYVARTAQQIGVRSFVTPTIESWASVGTGKLTTSAGYATSNSFVNGTTAAGSNAANFNGFQLGSNYWLSKRTNLYAIYGQQATSNQVYNVGNKGNPVSMNMNNYAVGLRHTF